MIILSGRKKRGRDNDSDDVKRENPSGSGTAGISRLCGQIVDVENGSRFETYTIAGEAGSGMICLNGAAARMVQVKDHIIIMAYCEMLPEEAKGHKPYVVFVDEDNKISSVARYEKHGQLSQDMK